jgi:hypothetical protein
MSISDGYTFMHYPEPLKKAPELSLELKNEVIKAYLAKPDYGISACGCMGPQDGEPLCPCAMRSVVAKYMGGVKRYFEVTEVRKELSIELEVTEIFGTGIKF